MIAFLLAAVLNCGEATCKITPPDRQGKQMVYVEFPGMPLVASGGLWAEKVGEWRFDLPPGLVKRVVSFVAVDAGTSFEADFDLRDRATDFSLAYRAPHKEAGRDSYDAVKESYPDYAASGYYVALYQCRATTPLPARCHFALRIEIVP